MSKVYFASDFHLGTPSFEESRKRENRIIRWLDFIKKDATALYLMGDIFDFWFEYKTVVPKGYIRFLGKLAELSDAGIQITLFKGNHDMWMYDYLERELNVTIVSNELILNIQGTSCFLHHGDGLGKGDFKYKILKRFFRSNICQWLFARLHPNLGIGIAQYWSKSSRIANNNREEFKGIENEWLYFFCEQKLQAQHYDYFVFGHRHLPLDIPLSNQSRYINLGEWINYNTYAVFQDGILKLEEFI